MNEPQAQLLDLLRRRAVQLKQTHEAYRAGEIKGQMVENVHDETVEAVPLVKFPPPGTTMIHSNISQAEMKALATVDEPPTTFLYATNQTEMGKAQEKLVAWAATKMKELRTELKDANTNLKLATERKWRKAPFESIVKKLEKQVTCYEKVEAALLAGYVIIPDMDVQLFAIRTTRKGATRNPVKGWRTPNDQKTNSPPLGEGRYVTPQGSQVFSNTVVKHEPGKQPEYEKMTWTEGHSTLIDFPFKMAKPQILQAAQEAMAAKIFDEVGALPRFRKQPDPVLVGRIVMKTSEFKERRFNFLIVWYLDTKEL